MNRRDLLRLLLASVIAEAVDVERLLWVPKPIVSVAAMSPLTPIGYAVIDISGTQYFIPYYAMRLRMPTGAC